MNFRQFIVHVIWLLFIWQMPSATWSLECLAGRTEREIQPQANQPSDISLGPNGDIYLVDGVNHRIIVMDRSGKHKFTFGKNGSDPGELHYPLGIDVAADGRVFVADSGNHRIQVFGLNGEFRLQFPVKAGPGDNMSDPVDVLVSKLKNYVYVSDNDNHKIKVYQDNGQFVFEWGKFGEGPGEFRYPGMLAINSFNEIYVVDVLNTRVQRFNPFGEFIAEIGSWGVQAGKLFRPKGLVVDPNDRVFVSDSYMGVVQVFSGFGKLVGIVCEGNALRRFQTPVGLAFDETRHRLQVVEMRKNQISVVTLTP